MSTDNPELHLERFRQVLDEMEVHVERSLASAIDPQPILLTQPPSSRENAVHSLREACGPIDALCASYRVAQERVGRALAALERRRFDCQLALAPISAVPPEILRRIFDLAVLSEPSGELFYETRSSPVTLAQVCARWRAVAQSQRDLWTRIAIHYPKSTAFIHRHSRLSSNKPIDVTVWDSLPRFPLENPGSSETWHQRIETLTWSSSRLPGKLLSETALSSTLVSLTIRLPQVCALCEGDSELPERNVPQVELPRLRHLSLETMNMHSLPAILAPNLVTLNLWCVEATRPQLRSLFQGAPNLEEMMLQSPVMGDSDNGASILPPEFVFTRLEALTLRDLDNFDLPEFLVVHRYPSLHCWAYENSFGGVPQMMDPFAILAARFVRQSARLQDVSMQGTFNEISELLHSLRPTFSFQTAPLIPLPPFDPEIFGDQSPRASLKRLDLGFSNSAAEVIDFTDELHMERQTLVAQALDDVLRSRRDAGLPALEVLELAFCNLSAEQIASFKSLVGELKVHSCGWGECTEHWRSVQSM